MAPRLVTDAFPTTTRLGRPGAMRVTRSYKPALRTVGLCSARENARRRVRRGREHVETAAKSGRAASISTREERRPRGGEAHARRHRRRVDSRSPIIPCREQRSRRGKEARGRSRPERRRARPFPHLDLLSLRYSEVSTKGPQRESGTFGRAFPSRYRRRAGKSHRRKTRDVFVPD